MPKVILYGLTYYKDYDCFLVSFDSLVKSINPENVVAYAIKHDLTKNQLKDFVNLNAHNLTIPKNPS